MKQLMWEGELQWRWQSYENWMFHFELLKFYKELLENNMSQEDILLWFAAIPSEYHTWSENNALHIAASLDNEEIVRLLVDLSPDIVNERNSLGHTALSIAVRNGNAKVVEVLLESRAIHDNGFYKDGFGPLHVAVRYGYVDIVRMLIDAAADVNAADKLGKTPLHLMIWNTDWDKSVDAKTMVDMLIEAGADVNRVNGFNETPLHNLVNNGHFDLAAALLDAGADPTIADMNSRTLLQLTVRRRNVEFTKRLLEKNVDVNEVDVNGWNALCYAVEAGSSEITRMLIDNGADRNVFGVRNFKPLFHAVRHENCELIELLMRWKPDVDLEMIHENHTVLQIAALQRRKDVLTKLLDYGAKISTKSKDGHSVLYYAAKPNNIDFDYAAHNDLLHFLISKEAGENLNEAEKVEILENAVTYVDVKVLQILVDRVVNLSNYPTTKFYKLMCQAIENKYDKKVFKYLATNIEFDFHTNEDERGRRSLLHVAARLNNNSVVKYLLKAGCDINCKSGWGRMPLHDAVKHVNPNCVRLLLSHNADVNEVDYIERSSPLGMAMADSDVERGKDIIFLIVRHIAMLEQFGKHIDQKNYDVIRSNENIRDYHEKCREEMRCIRERRVFDNITFFEVFLHAERYSRNVNVIQVFEDDSNLDAFEIYCDVLKEKFNKALKRQRLMERAETGLKKLLQCEAKSFTAVFDNIFRYLSNRELKNLILV